ncbi:MAG: hypothetical protein ACFFG0_01065 [Candidatus Thorarchaeota archaeon]
MNLCYCGCGEKVTKKGNKYILGHHRKNVSPANKGKSITQEQIEKQKETVKKFGKGFRKFCLCGCGEKVKHPKSKYYLGHNTKHKPYQKDPKKKEVATKKILKNRSWYRHSEETKKKIGKKSRGRKHSSRYKNRLRQEMLNGKAAYLNSCMKNPSKPQVDLYRKVLSICPYAILNYPYLNYSIDIAIPFLNIAIEYDGYFHFNSEKNIRYHIKRQKKLEKEGWKFIRYTIYDKFPKQKDIRREINECQ